ncbi:MAG: hypothetical protein JWN70_2677, partial [Planctomycetaceae bacterium]|nr:hypothetical protein [Planctomycetaceae bacterium]
MESMRSVGTVPNRPMHKKICGSGGDELCIHEIKEFKECTSLWRVGWPPRPSCSLMKDP